MSYFQLHYQDLKYPTVSDTGGGLYNAQVGAIHAIASHFTIDDQPAMVTMPTGSGKTAVLMMTPFVLKSTRTLIITPSRLVREQIADDLAALQSLKETGVLPSDIALPRVLEVNERIDSVAAWEALREYDAIVSTPNCTSPAYGSVPPPPSDLFDLLLVDEAHHSPAATWTGLLDAFPTTRRVLFTATPFRRDRSEIRGRFVYSYPIARAFQDRIFGKIAYVPVKPGNGESNDVAVARTAEAVLQADRKAELKHCLMVRTDRRTRADELERIYGAHTSLRLKVVHSGLAQKTVRKILKQLAAGELDGIICVNMMGEGFNFPRLKVAAIHAPHKSLEVTLQFIGRFARTNSAGIGEAKFIAVESEIEIERRRLFEEGVVWQEVVPGLSHGRIAGEIQVRERLQEFRQPVAADIRLNDLSLYSLYPRSHVKIYDVQDSIDFRTSEVEIGGDVEICYRNCSDQGDVLIMITEERGAPKWSSGEEIIEVTHDLFVLYFDAQTKLLFINSSRSVDGRYAAISESLAPDAQPLATGQVGRVVRGINNQRIFNVGMRNIQAANRAESYRIIAGSDTQGAITPADSRRYRQGHVFLAGDENGQKTTIGYSSGSKVWGGATFQIPELVEWCHALGQKIRSPEAIVTHSGLDYLAAGRVVDSVPERIIHVQWNKDAFDLEPPVGIEYLKDDGTTYRGMLLDLDVKLDREGTDTHSVHVLVSGDGLSIGVNFTMQEFYTASTEDEGRVTVRRGNTASTLVDYLNESYLDFYTADGALFSGNELFEPNDDAQPIDESQLRSWDWTGVDIQSEVAESTGGCSIHRHVRTRLEAGDATVLLYDHGSGEIADFVAITERSDAVGFRLYHCKGSAGSAPGARVADVYDVCGQAQKSVVWTTLNRLEKRLRQRRGRTVFLRGTEADLRRVLDKAKDVRRSFEIVIVQPGISKAALSAVMSENLGATNTHLIGAGVAPLEVISSE